MAKDVLGDTSPVRSVFFGGGTPTLLPAEELATALRTIDEHFTLDENAEVTTEANPDSVTDESLLELRSAGFNRISFGVQSFQPHVLKMLDRTHNPLNVYRAIEEAKRAGFEDISIDLIYGAPGESLLDVEHSVQEFLKLGINHISAYALIVEDGTSLSRKVKAGEIPAPDDDLMADKYETIDALLESAGFSWYELSNWSKPGFESVHNKQYWLNHNWWGIGPGAHSHINGVRWWNVKLPHEWVKRLEVQNSPAHARELLTAEQKAFEELMLKIRLRQGIDESVVSQKKKERLEAEQVIEVDEGTLRLTLRGRLLADYVVRVLTT
jgi:oxygen-independent coproporphyrinogen-3 oxidase